MLTSPLLTAALMAAVSVEAQPLAGEPIAGELQSVDGKQLVVATADGPRQLPLASLRSVQFAGAEQAPPPAGSNVVVELRDDSRLNCSKFTTSGAASVEFAGLAATIPIGAIRWVQLQSLEKEEAALQDWLGLLDKPVEGGDRLAYARERDGQLIVEHLTGTLYDVGEETVAFALDGDRLEPKRSKVVGLMYLPGRLEVRDTTVAVRLVDGSVLAAAELQLSGDELTVTTGAGVTAKLPLEKLLRLELGDSNITYLSDLEPTSVKCEPYFGVVLESELQAHLPRTDEDHHGQTLKVPGHPPADKGLAVRSQTAMVYRLQKPYKRLLATVGIAEHVLDSEIRPHLELVISSDDKTLLQRVIQGTEAPFDLDLDLQGVRRLTIEVRYGESQDIADYLHLCNARLTK